MPEDQTVEIEPLSCCSLLVETLCNGQPLAKATGFVVDLDGSAFLITNWHVLSGRDADTDQAMATSGALPDSLRIQHHAVGQFGMWTQKSEPLSVEGHVRWREHPRGRDVDVAALPLSDLSGVQIYPLDLKLGDSEIIPEVAMPVCIIGFPFGLSAGPGFPIWKIGHIASDPDLDFDGRPAFLIDATTREGMSGSPVVLKISGDYRQGSIHVISGRGLKLLGVYSGRIHGQADIGRVWRSSTIREVLGA